MTRVSILIIISVLGLSLFACVSNNSEDLPNIILIMADDLGWGDTGFNGNEIIITPSLDELAENGVVFRRFYSAAPVCSPTRASCLTGRHPYRMGIYNANSGFLKMEELTLAELLKRNGYVTGHFGKWHLGTLTNTVLDANRGGRGDTSIYSPPWENGFDVCFSTESKVPTWDPMITPGIEAGDIGNRVPGSDFGTYYWTGEGEIVKDNLDGDDSRIIMDRVIPFINAAVENNNPFLAVIWFHTPHLPVLTGSEYQRLYTDYSTDIQQYYGAITAMYNQVGRLVNLLKSNNVYNNTIIFFTSDNGPEGMLRQGRTQGSTAGFKGRKRSLYEGGIRVPGFMTWPDKIQIPSLSDIPVSTSDYYPTIMKITGINLDDRVEPIDGKDIMEMLSSPESNRNKPIGFLSGNQRALISDRFKIYSSDNGKTYELYDLINDPYEIYDLINTHEKKASDMVIALESWIYSCNESDKGKDYRD